MRPLNSVPWEDLQVGDKLVSATNLDGEIVSLDDRDPTDPDRRYISMRWNGVKYVSINRHYILDLVMYIGRDIAPHHV